MTSGNSVESVPDVPQQDNFVDTEPGNTPVQAQVPSRPGTDKMLVVKKGKYLAYIITALSREERDKYKCLYYLVETAMAVRQNDCSQEEELAYMGNYLNN